MPRSFWVLILLSCSAMGCGRAPAPDTTLELEGVGFAGATVRWDGESTTLDEAGLGSLEVGKLRVTDYGAGFGGERRVLTDLSGRPVGLEITRNGVTGTVYPFCIPAEPYRNGEADRVHLLLRREIMSGACAVIALEAEWGGVVTTGEYTPERFDDGPCSLSP